MRLEETDNFIEIGICLDDGTLIGTAEIEPNKHMLERFAIFTPFQDKGYGQEALDMLIQKYMLTNLWVRSDNEKAIHIYEKYGFKRAKETMFEMRVGE